MNTCVFLMNIFQHRLLHLVAIYLYLSNNRFRWFGLDTRKINSSISRDETKRNSIARVIFENPIYAFEQINGVETITDNSDNTKRNPTGEAWNKEIKRWRRDFSEKRTFLLTCRTERKFDQENTTLSCFFVSSLHHRYYIILYNKTTRFHVILHFGEKSCVFTNTQIF